MTPHSDSISYIGEVVTFNSGVTWGGTGVTYQWYVNGLAYPGATGPSFALTVYSDDPVYCIVPGNPPCPATPSVADTSNFIVIHAGYLGVNGIAAGQPGSLVLYPNPNTGSFTLSGTLANGQDEAVSYEVTDVLGQVLYRGTAMSQKGRINEQVSVANAAPGSYLLHVQTAAGNTTYHFVIGN